MPGIHSPITKPLFILDGLVKTSGGSKNLAKGQFAIVSNEPTQNGAKVIGDFLGLPKSTPLKIRVGRFDNSRYRSTTAPYYETSYFNVDDVLSVKANFPKFTKQTFDKVLVGWDGINDNTAIELEEGQTTVLDVIISGQPVEVQTGKCDYVVKMHFGREVGETNQEAIERLVERLQDFKLPFGTLLTDLIEIKVVNSENGGLIGTPYTFSTLKVTDDGSSNALAIVQSQYDYKVALTDRDGMISTYTILHPSSVELADFSHTVINTSVKGCAECLDGYDELEGGFAYSVTIVDGGANLSTTVDDLAGYVADTIVWGGSVDGVGTYTLVTSAKLTDAQKATFLAASTVKSTAEITFLGSIADLCEDSTTTEATWVATQTCFATTEAYKIQLADNECDGAVLTALQANYPNLLIEEGEPTGTATQTVTLSTDAAIAVIVNGVEYATADAGTTTQTATAFVAAHAAAILAATGVTVTSNTNVITFAGSAQGFPTITVEGQTVGAIDYVAEASAGGCQRVYTTQVVTDIVCDECDEMFIQPFKSKAPVDYDFTSWVKVPSTEPSEEAKMGILLVGKPFIMTPTEVTRDNIPFYETSTTIKVAGGYVEEENENFQPVYRDIFNVKRLSRAQDRDALGYHFLALEEMSRVHFLGEMRHEDNLYAQGILGEESVLKFKKQYVTYEVTVKDNKFSQGVGRSSDMGHTYLIFVELGYQAGVETLLNKLAAKAGVEGVNPTA